MNEERPYSRAALSARGAIPENEFLFFYGHGENAGEQAVFSNWWISLEPFVDNEGRRFPTNEHFMMLRKALLFNDSEMAARILDTSDPKRAKQLGRAVRNFDQNFWSNNCVRIVADGCYLKFSQSDLALDVLRRSGDRILVEAAPRDRIWGIGMGAKNPQRLDPGTWRGRNLLGEALMIARDRLRDNE